MPNPENLKPFKKGYDPRRNTTGENRGSVSITALMRVELLKCPKGKSKKNYADLIVKKILAKAIKGGNDRMIEKIWAYIDGMPKQGIEHSGEIKENIELDAGQLKQLINSRRESLDSK